ncbi:hypothetical protein RZE82_08850 [Mollicutes bacterium LVI A0039]|nr:hypothetical protein RZE82_08850 [Mollicutes bacterium LVI A0039]
MNNAYKLSILRIFDNGEQLEKENELANFCHVKYIGDKYILQSNRDYYTRMAKEGHKYINVIIDSDINDVVTELVVKVSTQILNPMETAFIYEEIFKLANIAQNVLANKIGKTQGAISNKLRLLKLPFLVQREIIKGNLKERHGRAILTLAGHEQYEEHARALTIKVLEENLRVVDLENEINIILGKPLIKDVKVSVKEIKSKRELKNREAIISLNQLNADIEKSFEIIKKSLPNVEIEKNDGVSGNDYIINIVLKDINKET